MQIQTKVFQRVVAEQKAAAITGIADIMTQTCRFGTFNRRYVLRCAKLFFEKTVKDIQNREVRTYHKKRTALLKGVEL